MSLFRCREWWGVSPSEGEESGPGCLCVGDLVNSGGDLVNSGGGSDKVVAGSYHGDKVVAGSYHGVLHLYAPSDTKQPHDVLLETNLGFPILQLLLGRFVSVSPDLHLAVLHPRVLSVYKIEGNTGAVDHGNQYHLVAAYHHKLERTACNMTFGGFGGVKGHDFICVQSMDGALAVFEHETSTFTRFLPDFLLPGPLVYNSHTDSFLTVSSALHLQSYSYQVLAVASDSNEGQIKGKRINVDWSLNLGEGGLEIEVVSGKTSNYIMVLGERSLFCVEQSGHLKFMKKFEFNASCFHCYCIDDVINTIVCSHSKQLLLFQNTELVWASTIQQIPISVRVGNFSDVNGVIVMSDEQCRVSCCYLGTAPSISVLPNNSNRGSDINRVAEKLATLNNKILALQNDQGDVILNNQQNDEDLKISVEVAKKLDKTSTASLHTEGSEIPPSASIQIFLRAHRRVTNVKVVVACDFPLHCTSPETSFQSISESDLQRVVRPSFYLEKDYLPATLDVSVAVQYDQVSGHPRVHTQAVSLPLPLVARSAPPVKKLGHRVTLESDKPCLNLMHLFPDFVDGDSGPNCIGIEYFPEVKATVLTSKTSNRYRIQCEDHAGLWLLTSALVARLEAREVAVSVEEAPSLEELAQTIDNHFQLRQSREEIRLILRQRALQFRVIQRRLLSRFKDKTPTPLNCLDTLLEGTHTQIVALACALERSEDALRVCSSQLATGCRLLALLTALWRGEDLSAVLCPNLAYNCAGAPGWEEMVDEGLTSLLRTTLARSTNQREGSANPTNQNQDLTMGADTSKIKKHLAILMDRLSKGGKLGLKNFRGAKNVLIQEAKHRELPKQNPDKLSSFYSKPLKENKQDYDVTNAVLPNNEPIRVPPIFNGHGKDRDNVTLPDQMVEEDPIDYELVPHGSPLEAEYSFAVESPSFYDDPSMLS